MKTKLFYHARWESGYEIEDEYRAWLDQFENSFGHGFHLYEKKLVGNWLIVRYWFNKNT